jgi:polysaccharide biosynthesis protein PslH
MKLLIVSTWCPTPPTNGSKLRAFHLIREMARRHQVRVVTFSEPTDDRSGGLLAGDCESFDAVSSSAFLSGSPGVKGLLSTTPRSIVQAQSDELAALVVSRGQDCDAALALELPAAASVMRLGKPFVIDDVELGLLRDRLTGSDGEMTIRNRMTWLKSTRFVMKLSKVASAMTSVSEQERAQLLEVECDPARVAIVPNGVDEDDLNVSAAPEPLSLVYPGSIGYRPNFDAVKALIDEILPRVHRTHPGVTLRVTGEADEERIKALAGDRSPAPGERVIFTGRVADVRPLIARSTVCVVPLRSGGGTRIKILQAMALGTPVVSTAKGAEGLSVVDGESIAIAESPDAFAAAIVRLLDDDAWRRQLSERGRALVRASYTWPRSGEALDAVLTRAVAAAQARSAATTH